MRTVVYLARLSGQSVAYAFSARRPMLLLVLLLAPVLVVLALLAGVTSPFLVYPFV
ncbi:MAG: hypothetical protein JWM47_415 [Acidimicrobiales bacterium]|nr:hypothetical protein [Acidimicrobiales bacterium]